jgi:hypothetical protein
MPIRFDIEQDTADTNGYKATPVENDNFDDTCNHYRDDENEQDDQQLKISEYFSAPRTTTMAKKSTSPIKFYLKNNKKPNNQALSSSSSSSLSSTSNNKPQKRKSSCPQAVKPETPSDTNKRLDNGMMGDIDDSILYLSNSFKRNAKRSKNASLGPKAFDDDISSLDLIRAIMTDDFGMDLNLNGIANGLIKSRLVEDYKKTLLISKYCGIRQVNRPLILQRNLSFMLSEAKLKGASSKAASRLAPVRSKMAKCGKKRKAK